MMKGMAFVILMLVGLVVLIIAVQVFLPSTSEFDCMRMCHNENMTYYEWVSGFRKEDGCLCYDFDGKIVDVLK